MKTYTLKQVKEILKPLGYKSICYAKLRPDGFFTATIDNKGFDLKRSDIEKTLPASLKVFSLKSGFRTKGTASKHTVIFYDSRHFARFLKGRRENYVGAEGYLLEFMSKCLENYEFYRPGKGTPCWICEDWQYRCNSKFERRYIKFEIHITVSYPKHYDFCTENSDCECCNCTGDDIYDLDAVYIDLSAFDAKTGKRLIIENVWLTKYHAFDYPFHYDEFGCVVMVDKRK